MTNYTRAAFDRIQAAVEAYSLVGNRDLVRLLLIAYFSSGHVLIEGPPGTGKTWTAKVLAHVLSRSFKRIQFTSDLLPADIIGANLYSPATRTFEFIKGPLFADIVLADEVNRTPPRTQSALLEAMEERQVTVDGARMPLSDHFFLIATQNPHDYEGTFPLPEVQLDRFLFKVPVQHGGVEVERRILALAMEGKLPPQLDTREAEAIDHAQVEDELKRVEIEPALLDYAARLLQGTRQHKLLAAGSSVRGGIALCRAARVLALCSGRQFLTVDDIKQLAPLTLAHRVSPTPEAEVSRLGRDEIIRDILSSVPFPS
jgi:MoxR-like ATPase